MIEMGYKIQKNIGITKTKQLSRLSEQVRIYILYIFFFRIKF